MEFMGREELLAEIQEVQCSQVHQEELLKTLQPIINHVISMD